MQILLLLVYTVLFLWIFSRTPFFGPPQIKRVFISLLFIFKVICGCALGLLYTYYYKDQSTADTFKFFNDSKVMFNALFTHPAHFFEMFTGINGNAEHLQQYYQKMNAWNNQDVLFNDNKTLVRLNVIFNFFSLGYYYVHVLFLNVLSFTGLIALFRVFQSYNPGKSKVLFFATLFLPSLLFWGSGLLKDGLLLFALGLLLYSFNKAIQSTHSPKHLAIFLISLLLLLFTKLYVLITIIPALIAWYWSRNDRAVKIIFKFVACYVIYLAIGFNIGRINEKYDVADILYFKQKNFYVLADLARAQSVIDIPRLERNSSSIIRNAPSAILRVFIRPSPADAHSLLIWMAALENILILFIAILCLVFMRVDGNINLPFFWFCIFFVLCMFALIGLITPILGALVRYKVPALPFLMFVFISLKKNRSMLN